MLRRRQTKGREPKLFRFEYKFLPMEAPDLVPVHQPAAVLARGLGPGVLHHTAVARRRALVSLARKAREAN